MLKLTIFIILLGFSILLFLLSFFKKLVFRPFYFILLAAAAASAFGVVKDLRSGGTVLLPQKKASLEQELYISAKLLEENRPKESLRASGQAAESAPEDKAVISLQALALNRTGSFRLSEEVLGEGDAYEADRLHELNAEEKTISPEELKEIAGEIREDLSVSESSAETYDMILSIRYYQGNGKDLPESGDVRSSGDAYAELMLADLRKDYGSAYKVTENLAESGDFRAQIALSEMFSRGFLPHDYGKTDEEYDTYLETVTELQLELDEMQARLGEHLTDTAYLKENEDGRAYLLKKTEYSMAVKELDSTAAKRAVNYLRSLPPEAAETPAWHLQMARLLYAADREEEAERELDSIFIDGSLDRSQWLGSDLIYLRECFWDYLDSNDSSDFEAAYKMLIGDLTQGAGSAGSSFREFLKSYLRKIYTGIRLVEIRTSGWPEITAELSSAREGDLEREMLELEDTLHSIREFTLEKREGTGSTSVCVVLDVSTSMRGEKLASAKNAIDQFLSSISGAMTLSYVTFSNDASEIVPLTDSTEAVSSAVRRSEVIGGTNIAAGLETARASLAAAEGNKYVILLSDGHDSSESQIGGVIARLLQAGIHVYTIGMSGANEAYLKRIADQTGGSFVFAANTSELNRTYADLQRAIMNIYVLHYTVEEDEEIRNRILTVRMKNDPAFTRKRYTLGLPKAAGKSGAGEAKSGYYTEIVE